MCVLLFMRSSFLLAQTNMLLFYDLFRLSLFVLFTLPG